MASQYVRLLDATKLSANKESLEDRIVDLGAYSTLHCHCRILKAGTGTAAGTIQLFHAAINEPDAFLAISGASWIVDSTAVGGLVTASSFLRYVKWVTDANVAGSPVVLIDIVAKGS